MKNVLGYEGRKVVITGAASGMGAAAARLLVELGAEVHALDIGEVKAPVAKAIRTDMKNKASIDAALAQCRARSTRCSIAPACRTRRFRPSTP
jgi:NAD(P)-dependent dehydrogenase (short-subunit alcohol dehydrogenase family)